MRYKIIVLIITLLIIPMIAAANETTNQTESEEYNFRIIVYPDTQEYVYPDKWEELLNVTDWVMNKSNASLVLHVGDFVEWNYNDIKNYTFFQNNSIPFASCIGNHDRENGDDGETYYNMFGNKSYFNFSEIDLGIISVDYESNREEQERLLNITKETNQTFIILIHSRGKLIREFYDQENVFMVLSGDTHSDYQGIVNNTYDMTIGDTNQGRIRIYDFYEDYIEAQTYSPTTDLIYRRFNMTYENKTINKITEGVYVPIVHIPGSPPGGDTGGSSGGESSERKMTIKYTMIPQVRR